MTGDKGNSEFCFPETLNVPRGEHEVEGKQNSLFPEGLVIKNRKSSEKNYLLEALHTLAALAKLSGCQD